MKVTRVAHLGFEAKNMDDMLKFYCDGLGMEKKFTATYDTLLDAIDHKLLPNAPEKEKAILSYWREQVKELTGQA